MWWAATAWPGWACATRPCRSGWRCRRRWRPAQRPPGRPGPAPGDLCDRVGAAGRHLRAPARRGAAGRGGGDRGRRHGHRRPAPDRPAGLVSGGLLVAVIAGYGACLVPTWLVAGGALVARAARPRTAGLRGVLAGRRLLPNGPPNGLLASGSLVMLLGSGPTLLAVGLAAQLHGTRWV